MCNRNRFGFDQFFKRVGDDVIQDHVAVFLDADVIAGDEYAVIGDLFHFAAGITGKAHGYGVMLASDG